MTSQPRLMGMGNPWEIPIFRTFHDQIWPASYDFSLKIGIAHGKSHCHAGFKSVMMWGNSGVIYRLGWPHDCLTWLKMSRYQNCSTSGSWGLRKVICQAMWMPPRLERWDTNPSARPSTCSHLPSGSPYIPSGASSINRHKSTQIIHTTVSTAESASNVATRPNRWNMMKCPWLWG